MKVSPYLSFNGNCAEAIALYEKAFNAKAHIELYKDAPPGMDSLGAADHIFDAQLKIGDDTLMFNDVMKGDSAHFNGNIMLAIKFDEVDAAAMRAAFDILKEEGQILMDICEVPWSKCFGVLIDKFGVKWNICQN